MTFRVTGDLGSAGSSACATVTVLAAASNPVINAWTWPTNQEIEIGVSHDPYWRKFTGQMDDVRIYKRILSAGEVDSAILRKFDIRQPVFFADIYWDNLIQLAAENSIVFSELPKQNPVNRDLALIVEKSLAFEMVEKAVHGIGLEKLRRVQLFDIFESEKLGKDKKSMAISFTFLDNEKTLTDKEIDGMMNRIMKTAEEELKAEIRK